MNLKIGLGTIVAGVFFFLGTIFALASTVGPPFRLLVAVALFAVGFGIVAVLYVTSHTPSELVQRIELSGDVKPAPITCPNCGATIAPHRISTREGVPYAKCGYCGQTVELVEEPKW
jgi:hypothetical protein